MSQVKAVVDRLLSNAGKSHSRWEQLLKYLEHFPANERDNVIDGLTQFANHLKETEARTKFSNELREKIFRHREYEDAHWVLPANTVERLEELQKAFEPSDLVAQYVWLFANSPKFSPRLSWGQRHIEVEKQQRLAITDIVQHGGVELVIKLAMLVESPYHVGLIAGKFALIIDDKNLIPTQLLSMEPAVGNCMSGYIAGKFNHSGWDWANSLGNTSWSAEQFALFLLRLPFCRLTWDKAHDAGEEIDRMYWTRALNTGFGLSEDDLIHAIQKFSQYERHFQSIQLLDHGLYEKLKLGPDLIMQILEVGLKPRPELTPENLAHIGHSIQLLFGALQVSEKVDRRRLAVLEWQYLFMFHPNGISPIALHEWLCNDAGFFAEVLGVAYERRDDLTDGDLAQDDNREAKGTHARTLLKSFKTLPGWTQGSPVDAVGLGNWVKKSRELSEGNGRLEICDSTLGEIFAYAPADEDGTWPCAAVRDLLDLIDTENIFNGFEVGIYNKRGMHSRSQYEGGFQERVLSDKYQAFAKACEFSHPATARSLHNVAADYSRLGMHYEDMRELE